ncbi:MAG: hypothetical protein NT138_06320 [Planctomycetales bacterium]|nr:hypothetical protein [Planctomycetales bacterium]
MRQLLKKLIEDQNGIIISSEIVLVGTILVLGSIVGLASLSSAVTHELNDVAQACDQTYNNNSDNNTSRNDYYLSSSQGTPEITGGGY